MLSKDWAERLKTEGEDVKSVKKRSSNYKDFPYKLIQKEDKFLSVPQG